MLRSRGFSLAELLISIMILSTLSVLIVGVIPAAVIGLKEAGERVNAAMVARVVLESLQRDGFDRLQNETLPKQVANGTEYAVNVTVGTAHASDGTDLDADKAKDVQVLVEWTNNHGQKSYTARMTFYRAI